MVFVAGAACSGTVPGSAVGLAWDPAPNLASSVTTQT